MYTINDINNTVLINKSKFITYLYNINSINEINDKLNKLKNDYNDATHICYAYVLPNSEKCSDDGEPSGTAGLPILNIIKKNNLTNTLAVVIRYFGGIKLGAGGLTRAYSNSVNDCIKLTEIIKLEEKYLVELEFSYDNLKLVDYMLYNKKILEKQYNDNITYSFYLNTDELSFVSEIEKIAIHVSIKDKMLVKD